LTPEQSAEVARRSAEILAGLPAITPAEAEPAMRSLLEELGLSAGQVFGQLREAVTGQRVSPPLFETMEIIGKDKVLERVHAAVEILLNYPDGE
jgi:glutamyl-tRNA synthetase